MKRTDGPKSLLKINVEVDRIGKMSLHISDLFNGKKQLGEFFYLNFIKALLIRVFCFFFRVCDGFLDKCCLAAKFGVCEASHQ